MKESQYQENEQAASNSSHSILALIIGGDSFFQDGVVALLTTMPQVSSILIAEDTKTALRMIHTHHPQLILLNLSHITEEQDELLIEIKRIQSYAYTIIIIESEDQALPLQDINPDSILLTGFTPEQLIMAVESIFTKGKGET